MKLRTTSVPGLHTLRAGDEEGSHAQPDDEPLSRPNWAEAHNGLDARGMHSREDEESKRSKDSAKADHLAEVAGIEESTNWVGEKENEETLRATNQVQFELVDVAERVADIVRRPRSVSIHQSPRVEHEEEASEQTGVCSPRSWPVRLTIVA